MTSSYRIVRAEPRHAEQLEELQRLCFPTLADEERFKAAHYRRHMELFPEGQLVAVEGTDLVIGATTTLRLHFDFGRADHTFAEIIQGGWLTSHEPDGDWLYGADISTHPEFRGRNVASALYSARHQVVRRLGLRGQVTAGMMPGYAAHRNQMTVQEYYGEVVRGELRDRTLSMQLRTGFEARGLLANYLHDPVCDNYCVLLVLPAEKDLRGGAGKGVFMPSIDLRTEIPGPRARAMLERRAAALPAGFSRATDVVVDRAAGSLVFDVDGNTLIDLAGGIGMQAVGHAAAPVVEAIQQQAARYIHPCALVTTYEPYLDLAELLNSLTPGSFRKKTLLSNSGAEAVEDAVKMARKFTGRGTIVCFEGAYHGRTLLTLSLTSKFALFKAGFGPFAPEIVRLPFPNVYRRPRQMDEEEFIDYAIAQFDHAMLAQVDPSAVAAILIEPVQGEGGFVPVPGRFFHHLRAVSDQHGIVLITDEIQCGSGRTGRLYASEHYGVVPDVMITAKSLGAGMPIGAVTGRAEIMDSGQLGGVGSTYGGSPVACAAALAALSIIRGPGFFEHAAEVADVLRARLEEWKGRYDFIGDVRGLGPMLLVEFVSDRELKTPLPPLQVLAMVREAASKGVILIRAGLFSNCIRFLPPLTIPLPVLREALDVVGRAIEQGARFHEAASMALAGSL